MPKQTQLQQVGILAILGVDQTGIDVSTVTAKEYLHLLVTTKQNILTSSARLCSINAIFRQLKRERKTITDCNKKRVCRFLTLFIKAEVD